MTPYGLYVHVPFCRSKCPYCDFASIPLKESLVKPYIDAIGKEIRQFGEKIAPDTVYFGGGTPTVLKPAGFRSLLETVSNNIDLSNVKEWTVEANPGTLDAEKIQIALEAGVDRFSLGMQSLDNRALRTLGRSHNAEEALEAYALLRNEKVQNISLDLIFGVPGTTPAEFIAMLGAVNELKPEHVSAYGLTFEKGTPFMQMLDGGEIERLGEEDELAMYLAAVQELGEGGMIRYEVSNFARPGFECRHNMAYWDMLDVLGVGPSAASYIGGVRDRNVEGIEAYLKKLSLGMSPVEEQEKLTGLRKTGEVMFLALRTAAGITDERFRELTGMELAEVYGDALEKLQDAGAVKYERGRLRLTERGFPVADTVLLRFL